MEAFLVAPDLHARVWGGSRLGRRGDVAIGEAWLTGPEATAATGPHAGRSLGDLSRELGPALIGADAPRAGVFPVLVKLLDPEQWLSVQVHPDDATAVALEGPGAVGKAEAWYCLEARADAEILLGVSPGARAEQLRAAIREGAVAGLLERRPIRPGDAYLVETGMLHAVGPGALLYEVQQPSDITYRVDDWGRPQTSGRALHTQQALRCVDPGRVSTRRRVEASQPGRSVLIADDHFVLEVVDADGGEPLACDPDGRTPHVLLAASGWAAVRGASWRLELGPLEAAVVPAGAGTYTVGAAPGERARVLLARMPDPADLGPAPAG